MKEFFKKYFDKIVFFVILILAVVLRLLFIDKPTGLWYDEIVSYKQASMPNVISVILYTLKTDVHLPLYQLFLHLWSQIFSFSDLSLRLFSAICGILTCVLSYFAGKELKDNKTGIIVFSMFAINSFLIFYSQEVRMYAFLMLLAVLNILFVVRIKNNPSKKLNYLMFGLSSICIIYTYTISFIYVFSLIFAMIMYTLRQNKEHLKLYKLPLIFVFCLPLFLFLTLNYSKYTTEINGYYCDWSSLFVLLQDLYSPVLESLVNNNAHYIGNILVKLPLLQILCIIIPIITGVSGLIYAIKKDKFSLIILSGSVVFLLAEIFAFKFTNFKILPRYYSLGIPVLILLSGYGISLMKKQYRYIFFTLFIVINLAYLIISPNSAFKLDRGGYKPLAQIVNSENPTGNDFIIVWNRKEILDKYVQTDANILSILKDFAYRSETMLENSNKLNVLSIYDRKSFLKSYFSNDKIPYNTLLLMNYIYSRMKLDDKFIITTTKQFDIYDKEKFRKTVTADYDSISLNDLLTLKSLTDIKVICNQIFKTSYTKDSGNFVVTVYKK